jgi:hypothetical protein
VASGSGHVIAPSISLQVAAASGVGEDMTIDMDTTNIKPTLEPVYFLRRSAGISYFVDILASVSSDESFGKHATSPSLPVGTFGDQFGIEKTFHG